MCALTRCVIEFSAVVATAELTLRLGNEVLRRNLGVTVQGSTGRRRACRQRALVLRLVEVTVRLRNEAIRTNRPLLVALIRTDLPVPPGPVFVPVQVQRKVTWLPSCLTWSIFTTMSGNAVMNPRAVSVMAVRPTDGGLAIDCQGSVLVIGRRADSKSHG